LNIASARLVAAAPLGIETSWERADPQAPERRELVNLLNFEDFCFRLAIGKPSRGQMVLHY
jgi:hypothetical protein